MPFSPDIATAPSQNELRAGLRENILVSIVCTICSQKQRTEGWLRWHLKRYHGLNVRGLSPAGVRETMAEWKASPEPWGHIKLTDPKSYLRM